MKKTWILLCSMTGMIILAGCLSLRIKSPLDPKELECEVLLCKEIDEREELYKPIAQGVEFVAGQDKVICLVKKENIYFQTRLQWYWYSPDNRIFKKSKRIVINEEGVYLKAFTAFDKLPPVAPDKIGQWTVVVFIDEKFSGKKMFSVVPKKEGPASSP